MEQNKQPIATQPAVSANRVYAQQSNTQEIDLVELFFTLLHNWKLLLIGLIMGAVIMAGYYGMFVQSTYRATTELYITNSDSIISLQDLQMGTALTEDYKTIITSRTVLNKVIEDLQLNMDYRKLRGLISVSNPTGTHIISTSVTTTNRDNSRIIANDLLNVSIERLYQVIGTSEPTIIDYSQADAVENVTPSLRRYIMMGGLIGMLLVAAFITIRVMMDTTLKTEDDVERYLKLPMLSSVPFFEDE